MIVKVAAQLEDGLMETLDRSSADEARILRQQVLVHVLGVLGLLVQHLSAAVLMLERTLREPALQQNPQRSSVEGLLDKVEWVFSQSREYAPDLIRCMRHQDESHRRIERAHAIHHLSGGDVRESQIEHRDLGERLALDVKAQSIVVATTTSYSPARIWRIFGAVSGSESSVRTRGRRTEASAIEPIGCAEDSTSSSPLKSPRWGIEGELHGSRRE
jgi:hypothetical protein